MIALIALAALASCTRGRDDQQQGKPPATPSTMAEHAPAAKKPLYRCTMHPAVTSDKPGICPICHMDLELVEDESMAPATAPATGASSTADAAKDATNPPAGRAAFTLSPEKQQIIGVTTAKIALLPLGFEVRASGRVAFDPDLARADGGRAPKGAVR